MSPAPERRELPGLTFATVDEKMDVIAMAPMTRKTVRQTRSERVINIVFSVG